MSHLKCKLIFQLSSRLGSRGYLLVASILIMALLLVLGAGSILMVLSNSTIARNISANARSNYIAESGVDAVVQYINDNGPFDTLDEIVNRINTLPPDTIAIPIAGASTADSITVRAVAISDPIAPPVVGVPVYIALESSYEGDFLDISGIFMSRDENQAILEINTNQTPAACAATNTLRIDRNVTLTSDCRVHTNGELDLKPTDVDDLQSTEGGVLDVSTAALEFENGEPRIEDGEYVVDLFDDRICQNSSSAMKAEYCRRNPNDPQDQKYYPQTDIIEAAEEITTITAEDAYRAYMEGLFDQISEGDLAGRDIDDIDEYIENNTNNVNVARTSNTNTAELSTLCQNNDIVVVRRNTVFDDGTISDCVIVLEGGGNINGDLELNNVVLLSETTLPIGGEQTFHDSAIISTREINFNGRGDKTFSGNSAIIANRNININSDVTSGFTENDNLIISSQGKIQLNNPADLNVRASITAEDTIFLRGDTTISGYVASINELNIKRGDLTLLQANLDPAHLLVPDNATAFIVRYTNSSVVGRS